MSNIGGLWGSLYDSYGFSADPMAARALSQDEMQTIAARQMVGMQQAQYSPGYIQSLANYQPPQAPLDERFADFKVRLAVAIERDKEPRR